jgi:DNA-binding transcriptional ArsR family regulator
MDDIARVAGLLADPARARMVWSLIDGTMRPAGELAYAANVSPQSASGHLAKLVDGGLIQSEAQGRHRYFRIASAEVAAAVEALASLAAGSRAPVPAVPVQFLKARTCYGHLAGEIAVKVLEGMLKQRWLAPSGRDYEVTPAGTAKLEDLGVHVTEVRRPRRVFARACVDLTQRRPHLGGALGDALLDAYVKRGWIQRQRRSRVVSVTPKGNEAFRRWFGASPV